MLGGSGLLMVTAPERRPRIHAGSAGVGLLPAGLQPSGWFTDDLPDSGPP